MSLMKRRIGLHVRHTSGWDRWKSCVESTMDIELPLDFKEFLKLLNEKGVRYLLIRGYAVGYHGYPRATNDQVQLTNSGQRLCHSSADKPIIRELYKRLNAEGWIDLWLNEEKLFPPCACPAPSGPGRGGTGAGRPGLTYNCREVKYGYCKYIFRQ